MAIKTVRVFLYSKELPKGKIFTDQAEVDQALQAGWVEAPSDIGRDPEEIKKRKIQQNPMSRIEVLEREIEELKAESSKLKAENKELKAESSKLKAGDKK